MAMTLVEAAKYSNDILQVGVIEKLTKGDPVLERLPFKEIKGNGLTYNVETTRAGADFYNVGDTWVEKTSTVTQATAFLKILGGDADVDNFLKATRGDQQDLMAEQITSKTLEMKDEFLEHLYYGYNTGNPKEFDGLQYLLRDTTYNSLALGTASGTPHLLNLSSLETVVDMILDGPADLMIMSKGMRRYINVFLNGVGGLTKADVQGKTVQTLFDIPVAVSEHIGNDESCDLAYGSTYGHNYADGGHGVDDDGATTIFVVKFDPKGLCGIQQQPIQVDRLGYLETKDAERVRLKWYCGIMLQNIRYVSKVTGVDYDGTVAA